MTKKTRNAARPRPLTVARDFFRELDRVVYDSEDVGTETRHRLRESIARGLRPFWLNLVDILERCIPNCRPLESADYRIEAVAEIDDAIDATLTAFKPSTYTVGWLFLPPELDRLLSLLHVIKCLGRLGSREAIAIQNHTYRLIASDLDRVRRAVQGLPKRDAWDEATRNIRHAG